MAPGHAFTVRRKVAAAGEAAFRGKLLALIAIVLWGTFAWGRTLDRVLGLAGWLESRMSTGAAPMDRSGHPCPSSP
jgi:hypothetical protein